MHRPTLGVIAAGLLVTGLVLTFLQGGDVDDLFWGGVLLRAGGVLGALWLVLPNARRMPRWAWAGLAVLGVVLALRPRLILVGFLLAVFTSIAAFLAGVGRRGVDRRRPE